MASCNSIERIMQDQPHNSSPSQDVAVILHSETPQSSLVEKIQPCPFICYSWRKVPLADHSEPHYIIVDMQSCAFFDRTKV